MNSFAKALGTLLNRTNATSVIGTTLASRSARRNYTTNKEAFRGRKRKIAIILGIRLRYFSNFNEKFSF
jgi:hypothetical protein